jgi:hypothetical protein
MSFNESIPTINNDDDESLAQIEPLYPPIYQCSICLEELVNSSENPLDREKWCETDCLHPYHRECIDICIINGEDYCPSCNEKQIPIADNLSDLVFRNWTEYKTHQLTRNLSKRIVQLRDNSLQIYNSDDIPDLRYVEQRSEHPWNWSLAYRNPNFTIEGVEEMSLVSGPNIPHYLQLLLENPLEHFELWNYWTDSIKEIEQMTLLDIEYKRASTWCIMYNTLDDIHSLCMLDLYCYLLGQHRARLIGATQSMGWIRQLDYIPDTSHTYELNNSIELHLPIEQDVEDDRYSPRSPTSTPPPPQISEWHDILTNEYPYMSIIERNWKSLYQFLRIELLHGQLGEAFRTRFISPELIRSSFFVNPFYEIDSVLFPYPTHMRMIVENPGEYNQLHSDIFDMYRIIKRYTFDELSIPSFRLEKLLEMTSRFETKQQSEDVCAYLMFTQFIKLRLFTYISYESASSIEALVMEEVD